MRQPLLSIERLLAVLSTGQVDDLLNDPLVIQAIGVATEAFGENLQQTCKSDSRLAETALKYLLRMGTRCTPFGIFAGACVGYPAQASMLNFRERQLVKHHRLDMEVIVKLVYHLSSLSDIKPNLLYFPNQTVFRIGNRLRYTERQWLRDQWQCYTSEVPAEPSILRVLELAHSGTTITDLVNELQGIEPQSGARLFVEQLIDDGLLINELMPTSTGSDALQTLIETLQNKRVPVRILTGLVQIRTLLAQDQPTPTRDKSIKTILTERIGLEIPPGVIVQSDLVFWGGMNQIGHKVFRQLEQDLQKLAVLNQYNTELDDLNSFCHRFYSRYEEQEIPLLLAIDHEEGVGYGKAPASSDASSALIDGLLNESAKAESPLFRADTLHELRVRLYSAWSTGAKSFIELTDQDLSQLGKPPRFIPATCYAFGYFLAPSAAALDTNQFQFMLKAFKGPLGINMMGRHCAVDAQLEKGVKAIFNQQETDNPGRLYAEIAHLPQARTGNVVQRPHLRTYEIPYLAHSSLPLDRQIPPDDLMVSVPNGKRVVIRSRKFGLEVIPQLTTAHDYRTGLPLYRFLCDVQQQDVSFSIHWNWGALGQMQRLPQVRYRSVILQEASWRFSLADLDPLLSDEENLQVLQAHWQLPRLIALQQGDQELFLDLGSSVCRQLFLTTLRRQKAIQVIEWLRTPDSCPVEGPDGKLTHEIVIPFIKPVCPMPNLPLPTSGCRSQRSFSPGSEWLYLKVYCTPTTASSLLAVVVAFAHRMLARGSISHWFFVRYEDPATHLRIRFRLNIAQQSSDLLTEFRQAVSPYLLSGEIHKVQIDTYQRELERYGDDLIEPTEHIFWHDSELVSQLLGLDLGEESLLAFAILSLEAYQLQFGLTLPERICLCEQNYNGLFNEHGASISLQQSLAQKYRDNQPLIKRLQNQHLESNELLIQQAVAQRNASIEPYVTLVGQTYRNQTDTQKLMAHVSSLSHLSLNRLFGSNQRTYELLTYHHLLRAYQSLAVRLRT